MLDNMHHTTINGGVFYDVHGNVLNTASSSTQSTPHGIPSLPRVRHAAYNIPSPARRQPHGCTEGTREAILAQLMAWAIDAHNTKIFWLSGMAGTGKTTIAYTFS